jgi:hypothetical protein
MFMIKEMLKNQTYLIIFYFNGIVSTNRENFLVNYIPFIKRTITVEIE